MAYFTSVVIRNQDGTVYSTLTDEDGDGFGAIDVAQQDQTSGTIDLLLFNNSGTFTLAATATVDSNTITVTAGHTIAVGHVVMLLEGARYSQFIVTAVVTNTITLDSPMDYAYTTGATGQNGSPNMGVNGSVTPVIFQIGPLTGQSWDIVRILFVIESSGQPDSTKFGDIGSGLTNGIVLRQKNSANFNQFNCKTNGDFAARAYDISYDDRASPASDYFFRARRTFGGTSKTGVVLRIKGTDSDKIQIIVQDNLSTLLKMNAVVQGHIVV
jgi:hypothetical protein